MTSRQARKLRREEARKAKKVAYKAGLQSVAAPDHASAAHGQPLDEEFSPEFLADAQAMRQRVERRLTGRRESAASTHPVSHPGFDSRQTQAPEPAPPSSRAAINRANAAHSTGPRSPHGKLASSRNSLKHGLASGTLMIAGEDPAAFGALLEALLAEHQPADTTEQMLIHDMAQSWWLAQRAVRLQNECFLPDTVGVAAVDEKRLGLFLRYGTAHQRAFHKALATLTRLQKDRRRAELAQSPSLPEQPGFVSQQRAPTREQPGFVSQDQPRAVPESRCVFQNTAPPCPADAA